MAYSKTRYSRGIVSTLADVNSLTSPQLGETCFCSENGKVMTYDGELWMCDDFIKATNSSGSTRSTGDVMTWVTTSGTSTEATISLTPTLIAGVVVWSSANGSPVALAYKGIYKVDIISVPSTYNRLGFFLRASVVTSGKAVLGTVASSTGWFGWNVELLGGSGLGLTKCLLRGRPELL
jgi:hypothetical protein